MAQSEITSVQWLNGRMSAVSKGREKTWDTEVSPGHRLSLLRKAVIGNRNQSPGMAKEDGIVDHESSEENFFSKVW